MIGYMMNMPMQNVITVFAANRIKKYYIYVKM